MCAERRWPREPLPRTLGRELRFGQPSPLNLLWKLLLESLNLGRSQQEVLMVSGGVSFVVVAAAAYVAAVVVVAAAHSPRVARVVVDIDMPILSRHCLLQVLLL